MNIDRYITTLEELTEDVDITLSEKQINKLSLLSVSLETRGGLELQDIYEELEPLIPAKSKDDENWTTFMEELAAIILDESEEDAEEDEEDE
jgi:hypothetical protein